jgi:protein-S-isoprenylcysteine O-methyltransferase Ste14
MKSLLNFIDSCIYLLIGPFTVLYLFPQFFRELESHLYYLPFNYYLDKVGFVFMWSGAVLAICCSLLMFLNKFSSVIPFFKPTKLVTSGPYKFVRHPMMWALFLVLIGESITFSSPLTLLWLIIWARFSHIYISRHEEPFLLRHFGEEYQKYAQKVPRWIPGTKPHPIIK